MDNFSLNRNEIKGLLALAAIIPVLCFITGFYTAFMTQTSTAAQPLSEQSAPVAQVNQKEPAPQQKADNRVRVKQPTPPEAITARTSIRPFLVQAGLFSTYTNALAYQKQLITQGLDAQIIDLQRQNKPLYRIVLHRAETEAAARQYIAQVQQQFQLELFLTRVEPVTQHSPLATL